ncbi:chaperonin 10-like protein [Infundibulicybe gibba]|nr:chaperonin 10-like protein [Infundibulicybe gibba]
MSIPSTQRSPSKGLALKSDYLVPKPELGEVLVKIQAAALNPVGYKLMKFVPNIMSGRPFVAEHDFTGIVADANGTEFSNGNPVFGCIPVTFNSVTKQGALAEYVRVPASHIAPRPQNISPTQAAGIALVAQTAYQALFQIGGLEAGQTIFINGGSTSVGAYAIQIAKAYGAKVVAAASGKNEEFVRKMGADEVSFPLQITIPRVEKSSSVYRLYRRELCQQIRANPPPPKFHIIFDAAALADPSLYTHSHDYLAPNGVFITAVPLLNISSPSELWQGARTMFAAITPGWMGGVKRKYKMVMVENKKDDLMTIQKLVAEDSVYEFDDVLGAYDRMMSSRTTGKIIVKIVPDID